MIRLGRAATLLTSTLKTYNSKVSSVGVTYLSSKLQVPCFDQVFVHSKNFFTTSCLKMGSQHELSLETPILYLKTEEAFAGLSDKERHFAHHLSRASWWGGFIILCQTSPESPVIFSVLTRLFRSEPIDSLKNVALTKANFTEDEFKGLMIYYCGLLYNAGNYLGFGDRKFIPTVSKDKLRSLIQASKAYLEAPTVVGDYLTRCLDVMYDLDENKKFLGLPPKGVTMYFTPNCCDDDANLVKEYMTAKNIEAWNTRLIKHEENGDCILDIRYSSVEDSPLDNLTKAVEEFKGHKFKVTRGDYSFFLSKMVDELNQAKEFAANDNEIQMLNKYVESFTTGSIKAHKEGSTFWVKNKAPAVESYIGFIEVYRDPTEQRAEFESFVAMVNREQSRKFDILVDRAEKEFLCLLPWGKEFEENEFLRPDFTSLDILTFATSGLPIGINIPNYKDIKEEQGFKNVSLTNVMAARAVIKGGPFLSDADNDLREKYGSVALEIQVGLHELLGHGCGKFFRRKDDGTLNFDSATVKNPFTGEPVGFYETGENYQSKFTSMGSAYEECRAETVALYLCLVNEILDIFSVQAEDMEHVKYVCWLDLFYAGLKGLELYQPSQKKWGQAHSQARYVILRVGLEAGEGLVNVTETVGEDGLPDLSLTIDRSKIPTVGYKAFGEFLKKLQVYRSMGDIESAKKMFEGYSEVPEDGSHPFAKWHEIVVRKRRPRLVFTFPNTRIEGSNVDLVSYPDGAEGTIASWTERFTSAEYEKIESSLLSFTEGWSK